MARARNIKPGFFTNDILSECDPLARLMFAGMWCVADRSGRLEDRPKKIKAETLPYDECNPDDLLNQLEKHGFVLRYESGGNKYIQILAFEKHQNPHVKEPASTIPAPDKNSARTVKAEEKPERATLIPDSLNLIPDTREKHDADAYTDDPVSFIFSLGKQLMGEKAGSLIGKARKSLGDQKVAEILAAMSASRPPISDPLTYFAAAIKPKERGLVV